MDSEVYVFRRTSGWRRLPLGNRRFVGNWPVGVVSFAGCDRLWLDAPVFHNCGIQCPCGDTPFQNDLLCHIGSRSFGYYCLTVLLVPLELLLSTQLPWVAGHSWLLPPSSEQFQLPYWTRGSAHLRASSVWLHSGSHTQTDPSMPRPNDH